MSVWLRACRLKLLQGTQFIYLLRGLPRVLILDHPARAVGWGVLQLVFSTTQQLECFLAVLRHVTVGGSCIQALLNLSMTSTETHTCCMGRSIWTVACFLACTGRLHRSHKAYLQASAVVSACVLLPCRRVFSAWHVCMTVVPCIYCMQIVPGQLWPRHITSLWRPVISEPGADPAQHTNPQSVQQDTPQQPALIRSPRHTDTHSEPHTRHLPARTSHKEQLHTPVFAAGPHGHGEGHQEWFGSYVRWAVDNRWLVGGLVVAAGAALWLSGYRSQARAA